MYKQLIAESKKHTMEKEASSINGTGQTKQLQGKDETRLYHTQRS